MRSLKFQLSLGFSLIVLITAAVISIASNILISRQFEKYIVQRQQEFAAGLAENLRVQYSPDTGWNLDYVHGFGMYALNDGYIIKLYDSAHNSLWDAEHHDMALCHRIMTDISKRMEKEMPEARGDFITAAYELKSEGRTIGFTDISYYSPYYSPENDFGFLRALNRVLLFVGIIALIGAVVSGALFASRITDSLEKTTKLTGRIADGDYSVRLAPAPHTLELDRLSQSVNHLAEALSEQEELRRRFTSDIAHELRTPIANVSAYMEAMTEGVWEPTPKRLEECSRELERITGIVADLDELHSIEADRLMLEKEEFDLTEPAIAAVSAFGPKLSEKRIGCTVSGGPLCINADRRRVHQVIFNLISNAVKYTDEGGSISINIADDGTHALLSVEDSGIGIPENELERIFERFYRTDASRSRKTGGAGIGLSIVKAVVEAHGGTVTAESTVGTGSRFCVRLPK